MRGLRLSVKKIETYHMVFSMRVPWISLRTHIPLHYYYGTGYIYRRSPEFITLRTHAIHLILIQLNGFGVSLSEGLSCAPFYGIDVPKSATIQIRDENHIG